MNLLERIYELDSSGELDDAMDILFDEVDGMLWACDASGDFEIVDRLLEEVELARLSSTLIIGFLTITRAAHLHLKSRERFVARCESRLADMFPGNPAKVESLMKGLRS